MLGLVDFRDTAILCDRPNNCSQQDLDPIPPDPPPQRKFLITLEPVQVSCSYFLNTNHVTCPYLECGYNGKYKTSHNFPFS